MHRIDQLAICPDVTEELQKLSCDLVGYVIERGSKKVVDTAIIRRGALASWYENRKKNFPEEKHAFVVSTTSIVGVVLGMRTTEVEKDDEKGGSGKSTYDYHVN